MLIERAIAKLKKSGGLPDADSGQRAKPLDAGSQRQKPPAPQAPPETRVTFPSVALDSALLERNRIIDPSLSAARDPQGQSSFRMLRSRLLNKLRSERWASLAITSPGAGEGKTLVAINLAFSIAREGASDVFLVDCDMRNPSVCRYLGVTPPREIVDYFAGSVPVGELFFSAGLERLAIAGGLNSTESASEYLASRKFDELLAYIQEIAYNPVILVDLPPMLVSDEAILVAPRVDATTLVIAEGRTNRDGLQRAKQLLEGHTLAGVILNRSSDALAAADYYGYGYGNRAEAAPRKG